MSTPEQYAVLYFLSGVVSLGVATWVWRRRDHRGATTFIALLFVVAIWTFVDALAILTATTPGEWVVWQKVRWSVAGFVPGLWFLFTLRYTDLYSRYVRPAAALVLGEALALTGLTLTNGSYGHELVWETVQSQSQPVPVVLTEAGPAYVVHMFVTTWLVLGGIVLLLQVLLDARDAHRSQPAVLIAAGSIAIAMSVSSALDTPLGNADYTPVGLGLGSVVVAWALYRHRLFDIYPVETETVMTAMRDAVVVVNEDRLVTDHNPAGAALLSRDDPLGTPIEAALPLDVDGDLFDREAHTAELTGEIGGERRHFLLDVSPLSAREDRRGHLLIFRDETTRRKQHRELERQSEHMEQFASTVSHDLRNPLKVAESATELLERKSDDREVEMVADSLDRMRTIIDEALAFARSGQRMDEADLAPVDLDAVATGAWEYVDAPDAALEIASSATVDANEQRLRRMFENLFRNAVEHGAPDATVEVGALEGDRGFYVEDDGPGIPDDRKESVFERGFTTETDGTGFGLAIVDAIVGAHDWEISVADADGGGARFVVET